MSFEPRIDHADEACMMATWGPIAFPVFGHRPATVVAAQALGGLLERYGRAEGAGRLVEISLLDPHMPTPSADVRQALDGMVPRVSPYYAAVAAIFEGSGFRSAVIRGVLTGFQILSRNSYPQKVFGTIDECAAWVLPFVQKSGTPDCDAAAVAAVIRKVHGEGVARGVLTAS